MRGAASVARRMDREGAWRLPVVAIVLAAGCGRLGYQVVLPANGAEGDGAAKDGADGSRATADGSAPGSPDGSAAPALEYCTGIPALGSAPRIDGMLEPGLPLRRIEPVRWTGAEPLPPEHLAELAVGWWSDSLYFFLRVTDPTRVPARPPDEPRCGDGVEMFVDDDGQVGTPERYDDPGTRQLVVAAPHNDNQSIARGGVYHQSGYAPWSSTEFRAYPTPSGYVVEARVTAEDLGLARWRLAAGARVGLDVSIDVSYPALQGAECMNRLGQYFLHIVTPARYNDTRDEPGSNPDAFCTPRLLPP
jgi:hypothetical protein